MYLPIVKGGNPLFDIPLINIKHVRNKLAGILILSSFKKKQNHERNKT